MLQHDAREAVSLCWDGIIIFIRCCGVRPSVTHTPHCIILLLLLTFYSSSRCYIRIRIIATIVIVVVDVDAIHSLSGVRVVRVSVVQHLALLLLHAAAALLSHDQSELSFQFF